MTATLESPRSDRRRRRRTVSRLLRLATLIAALIAAPDADATALAGVDGSVVERAVTFVVANTNTSGAACPSDGGTYELRGVLTGPRDAFESGRPQTLSMYLHGFSFGGMFLWSFKAVPGYDWPVEMAGLGHVSLSVDRLGYDSSGHPNGWLTCMGSGADVAHQLVQAVRSGEYEIDGGEPISVDEVVLVGHDTGGGIAEIEAYAYDDIDGLVVWGWADQGFSQWVLDQYPGAMGVCARGGEEAESGAPGGGYVHWPATEQEVRDEVGARMDPEVLDAAVPMRNRNPCGDLASAAVVSNYHEQGDRLGEIDVPVLLIYSDDDLIFTPEGAAQQPAHFTGTDDLTYVMLEDAGHFPMLERRAPEHRRLVSEWLDDRGFGCRS